jgi:hypothetical protein
VATEWSTERFYFSAGFIYQNSSMTQGLLSVQGVGDACMIFRAEIVYRQFHYGFLPFECVPRADRFCLILSLLL